MYGSNVFCFEKEATFIFHENVTREIDICAHARAFYAALFGP